MCKTGRLHCISYGVALALANLAVAAQADVWDRPALPLPGFAGSAEDFRVETPGGPAPATADEIRLMHDRGSAPISDEEVADLMAANAARLQIESICGPTIDVQDVERYDGKAGPFDDQAASRMFVDGHEPSTAQLQWNDDLATVYSGPNAAPGNVSGARWCTGTLIAEDLLLTAGHCFDQTGGGWIRPKRRINGEWGTISSEEIATRMRVNFNYQIDAVTNQTRTPDIYPVLELLENWGGGLDYAIVRLGGRASDDALPGANYPVRTVGDAAPAINHPLVIVQHPSGWPKKVHGGPLKVANSTTLYYDSLDTLGGSSGAGVLDDQGVVVGVHVRGGCAPSGGNNKATSIAAIRSASSILATLDAEK